MYPLLVSAISTIASSMIDKWTRPEAPVTAAPAENFAALMEKSVPIPPTAAAGRDAQIAVLRQRLLDSPELHTLLASADPAKSPTLGLAADGTLSARTSDGRVAMILLSPESAATARELASLTTGDITGVTGLRLETARQVPPASL